MQWKPIIFMSQRLNLPSFLRIGNLRDDVFMEPWKGLRHSSWCVLDSERVTDWRWEKGWNLVGKTFGLNGFSVFVFGKSCDNLRGREKKVLKRRFLSHPASEALNFISRNKRQPILIQVLSKNLHHIFFVSSDVRPSLCDYVVAQQ